MLRFSGRKSGYVKKRLPATADNNGRIDRGSILIRSGEFDFNTYGCFVPQTLLAKILILALWYNGLIKGTVPDLRTERSGVVESGLSPE